MTLKDHQKMNTKFLKQQKQNFTKRKKSRIQEEKIKSN